MAAKSDDEILRYLECHKIMQLFENLTSCLFYDKPDNPKEYLINRLNSLIAARDKCLGEEIEEDLKLPNIGLFTSENVVGMFEMLDSQHRGFINLEKYRHGMIV
uniref:EF-hand domain-containing protein n=1 Tax=Strigamia maritima TaxID=126957 RepID=T1JK62_STRMM